MSRFFRLIPILVAAVAVAAVASACGQATISVPKSDVSYKSDDAAAKLFHQDCGGCHTLSIAATSGSGQNPRTYLDISGPNFNVRCERPVTRVLYAIENGGFGGAYMPQNIVVGQQARELALFVAKFAGSQAASTPGQTPCSQEPIGSLPALPNASGNSGSSSSSGS